MQQDEIIIHGPLLTRAFRRQLRLWAWLAPLLLAALLAALLALLPRSYTSTASVAIQQSSPGGSALALLAGGGAPAKRYIGVLKSRDLAEFVERRVHLRDLYGTKTFPTEADAVQMLTKSIKPEDSATDGLLYVSVTLPGPPKLSLKATPTPVQVEDAAARTANAYTLGLKKYYIDNDTDQSTVLLRQADKEVRSARRDYNDALDQVLNFSRGLSRMDPRSAPGAPAEAAPTAGSIGSGSGTDASVAATGLGPLYAQLGQTQTDLRAAQAVRQTGDALTAEQLRALPSVPADDPLLISIRNQVKADQANYNTSSRLFGPENPAVINARERLKVDSAELARQVEGVKSRRTTPSIRTDQQIQGLYARQKSLRALIAQAERRLGVHRQLSGEMLRLQAEVGFRAEVLKTALIEGKKIKLNNASALSRMSVVDPAIPPRSGSPGVALLAAVSLVLVLLLFGLAVTREYLRLMPTEGAAGLLADHSANGTGAALPEEPSLPMSRPASREK